MPAPISSQSLHEPIATRFEEAQNSLVNHRKNCVGLYNSHLKAAKASSSAENLFADVFIALLGRVMDVKKGPCPDRIIKFVGSYVKFIHDKVSEESKDQDDTLASRFVTRLLKWLLHGFHAKNKSVRLRAITLVAEIIFHVGEMDNDTYDALRDSLTDRICDKEPSIRAQAVIGLSKLIGTEDVDELKKGEKTILEIVIETMCHDTAPEVRRAALLNIPLTPETLPIILTRTHDVDTLTRKLAYSAVLGPKLQHPQQLTISQREELVKTGLGERESTVRAAVGKVLEGWFDIALSEISDIEDQFTWQGDDGGIMKAFIRFLAWFDVVGTGEAVAVDAILSVFTTRVALCNVFVFQEEYWQELTAESAVLARIFIEHCLSSKNQERLEKASLPVVTAFALLIQDAYNGLLKLLQDAELLGGTEDDEEAEARDDDIAKCEVVLTELLRMALRLDYMDEIGRRKVFSVVKDMLAHPHLPPGLIASALDLLREIIPSERDLIMIVVEIIIELREGDENVEDVENNDGSISSQLRKERSMRRSKQSHEMTEEERREADLTDMKCLTLCIGMLERVNGSFEDNPTLDGMLTDLIIPAVKRKELAMREKGLVALGLCCLIAKKMALNSFQLFFNQVQTAPEDLTIKVLQVIFDLLVTYEHEFLGRSEEVAEGVITFLVQILEAAESDRVQAVMCIGLSKLLLCGLITDTKVLTSLVLLYISPSTRNNTELKQCLSYFFPVYCYSSPANQDRLRSIFISAYDLAVDLHDQLEDDQEMISPYQFGQLLVDWTNPAKASYKTAAQSPVHSTLCIDLLKTLFDSDRTDHKVLCQLVDQIHTTTDWELREVIKISILLDSIDQQRPYDDPAVDKVLNRFKSRFSKLFSQRLETVDLREHVEDLKKIYDAIGAEAPDPQSETPLRVRLSFGNRTLNEENMSNTSRANETTQLPEDDSVTQEAPKEVSKPHPPVTPMKKASKRRTPAVKITSPPRKKRNQIKGRRKNNPEESASDEDFGGAQPEPEPSRQEPRRSARTPRVKPIKYEETSEEDNDEEEESEGSVPPARRRRQKKALA